jgi:uncharacterized repeat protein (TIGR01451 family)
MSPLVRFRSLVNARSACRPRLVLAPVLALGVVLLAATAAFAAPPVAEDDAVTVAEDTAVTVDVLANDTDPDGDPLAIVDWTAAANGDVFCDDATCSYEPAQNFSGTDSFTYTVDDGTGATDTATLTVTVTGVNDPPEARDDQLVLTGGATSGAVDVLANDSDPEGDAPTMTGETDGDFGTVDCTPQGTCTYTGGASFSGTDNFAYEIADTGGETSSGSVRVCSPVAASALANAIAADAGSVTGASYEAVTECGSASPNDVSTTPLTGFPTASSSYSILTSGDAALADDPNSSTGSGAALGGQNIRGDTDFDVTILKIDLQVPANRNCLTFDFRFLSEEFPEYVGSSFNDAFIAELDSSTWSTSGSTITAANNFAFDPTGDVISINSSGSTSMTPEEAVGTTYDGATPLLGASTPITAGAHSLYLSIFDQGDQILDSAVFVDNLVLGTTAAGGCQRGATPLSAAKTADSGTTPAGGSNGYTIKISNPSDSAVTLDSVFDVLPEGFTYVNGTTTGVTTADPTIAGQTLTWSGPFSVPANGDVALHFGVKVSTTPGEYLNDAGGSTTGGSVSPTGPTAKITVTPAPTASADLSLSKTDSLDPVEVGQQLTYEIIVQNHGPDDAADVLVTDHLPPTVDLDSVSASQGTCPGTSPVTCDLGTIAAGASATVTIKVTPTADDDLSNEASVSSTTPDPAATNNADVEETVVKPAPTGPTCDGLPATFVGSDGDDYIQLGPDDDVVVDPGGDNYVQTGGGDDHVCLGDGNDEIDTGDGNDFVDAGGGSNKIKTGNGGDSVRSGTGDDRLDTGSGDDQVVDLGGTNKVFTGNEADRVTTGSGRDEIETGKGDDIVEDGGGDNTVKTEDGNDQITTGAGDDRIDGGNGSDSCDPNAGVNRVRNCEA